MNEFAVPQPADESSPFASTPQTQAPRADAELQQLLRLLYNHNPLLYRQCSVIFSGLWKSFTHDAALVEAGAIAGGLAAYALLLALTAWLIVRLGHVWDDARSILLLVVLMFLAVSVSCDPILNAEEQPGTSYVLGGLLLSLSVSEALFRYLPLRLPLLYKVPYYLLLALFFLYPLAISPLLRSPPSEELDLGAIRVFSTWLG